MENLNPVPLLTVAANCCCVAGASLAGGLQPAVPSRTISGKVGGVGYTGQHLSIDRTSKLSNRHRRVLCESGGRTEKHETRAAMTAVEPASASPLPDNLTNSSFSLSSDLLKSSQDKQERVMSLISRFLSASLF